MFGGEEKRREFKRGLFSPLSLLGGAKRALALP